MKKIILLIAITFAYINYADAQEIADNAIGLRLGDNDGLGAEVSYQMGLSDTNRLEFGLAWRSRNHFSALKLTGLYQWVFTLDGLGDGFNWYAGAGGGFGSWKIKNDYVGDDGTFLFVAGDIGIEYKFDFPLLLSLDFRPELGFSDFNNDLGLDIALGARYTF